jgi:hypothetical protein
VHDAICANPSLGLRRDKLYSKFDIFVKGKFFIKQISKSIDLSDVIAQQF